MLMVEPPLPSEQLPLPNVVVLVQVDTPSQVSVVFVMCVQLPDKHEQELEVRPPHQPRAAAAGQEHKISAILILRVEAMFLLDPATMMRLRRESFCGSHMN